ncbi:MAG: X-Pro aminopeptidase [Flavobacteriales bacterium]|nr:X-Pro aminopeptidase [Flavobacteriales bacterium]
MRYPPLSAENYIRNRADFAEAMNPGAMALFSSNDIYPTSADGTLPFRQDSNMLHLCGVDQEETLLLLFPHAHNPADREILFVTETNEEIAIWEGAKLTKAEATAQTGVKQVQWLSLLERTIQRLVTECSCCYLHQNEHTRAKIVVQTREARFNQWFCDTYPHVRIERAAPILHRTRSVKSAEEIERMRHACGITRDGFNRVMNFLKPGVTEYEVEAEYLHEFVRKGSRGFAYTPIVASGANACVLHYIENSAVCKAGDVLLMDVGAEYGNYASDMTRCLPVSGRFTDRQRKVYDAVLSVMRDATKLLRPGVSLHDYHKQVGELMTEQLLGLGLIDKHDVAKQNPAWPAYKKYFMHGTSHFIGLDVHDVGLWHEPIRAGHVFTVEPGIYILGEGLGIRLENDIVVTEDGFDDLMGDIPLDAEAIEDAMNS